MAKIFYSAEEVADMLDVSMSQAYTMIKKWNKELADRGFITIAGKVNKKYLHERIYGYAEEKEVV